jgi:hypothetical protein
VCLQRSIFRKEAEKMLLGRECQGATALPNKYVSAVAAACSTKSILTWRDDSAIFSVTGIINTSATDGQCSQSHSGIFSKIFTGSHLPHFAASHISFPVIQPARYLLPLVSAQLAFRRHGVRNLPRNFLFVLFGRGPPISS